MAAKSEALVNIHSLLKQNIKKSVTLIGEGNEDKQENSVGLISKKTNFARASHFFCTFLCRCFARLLRETSGNFLITQFHLGGR